MSQAPVASVVIPVLNGEGLLGDLLSALKGQVGVPGEFEVIVVDNGSTDRTAEAARSLGARVVHEPRRGCSRARNAGAAAARGRVIAYTDCDTRPSRRWLASLVRVLEAPGPAVATGPILGWPPSTAAERFTEANGNYSRKISVDHPVHPYATGMNLALKREDLLAVGGWDTWMNSGEDVDLCIRLRQRMGATIEWTEGASLLHRHRADDAALWRQACWYGRGYGQLHLKHPHLIPWRVWNSAGIVGCLGLLYAIEPLVHVGRCCGLVSAERREFERYYRGWQVRFWGSFFQRIAEGGGA